MSLFWILLAPAVGKWFARASKLSRRLPARWSYSNRIRPLSRSMTARCSAALTVDTAPQAQLHPRLQKRFAVPVALLDTALP